MNTTPGAAHRPGTAVLAAATILSGCAGVDLTGFGVQRAEPGARSGFSFTPDNRPAAKAFIGSEIDGLLKKHPITSSQRPETWPRVAITVINAPPNAFKTTAFTGSASIQAQDCATYSVRVWRDARTSQSYDNLRLCYGDVYQRLQGVPLFQVPTWGRRSFWPDERNTGSVRNDGPVPPADHFPNDPRLQNLWLDPYKNTLSFVAGPLAVLGFNWNDVTDKRVWFVSVPAS